MTGPLQRIEQNIQSRHLLKRGQPLLVAVSGGLDSMALLHALQLLAEKWQWQIIVAHFNHQLRGRSSDADEKLVRKIAAAMKLKIVIERADVKSFAKKTKLSVEMAARKLRHEFFAKIARKRKISAVALAHHADDQVELFFLRVLRGAGGEGLAGMKWQSPSSADKTILLIRPLLDLGKDELREFVRKNKIPFREDASNFSNDFLRNKIRNELLPLLRKNYQPGLDKTVLRLMEITGAESDFVGLVARASRPCVSDFPAKKTAKTHARDARATTKHRADDFEKMPTAIQRRILQAQLTELGFLSDFELVEQLRRSAEKFVSVNPSLCVARGANGKLKLRNQSSAEFNSGELKLNFLDNAGRANFDGVRFNWNFEKRSPKFPPRRIGREFFDADKTGKKIILRHWRAGDRFQPIGLKSPVKLQDLFTNAKIPRAKRFHLILAETIRGEIFWVESLRISENFKLTPETKRRLVWCWRRTATAV